MLTADACNHVAQAQSAPAAVLPASLRTKYPDGVVVRVLVQVDENGKVANAGMWGGPTDPKLASAARAAAMRTTFTPAAVNCKPIPERLFADVKFVQPH
jgi:TonB family protein